MTHFVASAVAGTPAIPATSNPSKSAGENGGADDPLTEVVPVHEPWVPTVQDVRRPANDKHANLLDKDYAARCARMLPQMHTCYTHEPRSLSAITRYHECVMSTEHLMITEWPGLLLYVFACARNMIRI